jgi:Ca-activated chloride channel homolog
MRKSSFQTLVCLSSLTVLALAGCSDDSTDESAIASEAGGAGESGGDEWGDGDGDHSDSGWEGGDGDPTGGDGDPTDGGGDGDGDPSGTTTGEEGEGEEEGEDTDDPVCDDAAEVVLYLSPDDSNSMSSPVQVRERIVTDGSKNLSTMPIRVWEFMNYYEFGYPAAEVGELALHGAMQPVEGEDATYRLQFALSSEIMTAADRPDLNLSFVLDTSGSMAGVPIEMMKESCKTIAGQLRDGDTVSMVEWDDDHVWTLAGYPVTGPNDAILLNAIEALTPDGGTNLHGGLVSGYELAQQVFDSSKVNRLVLISDGWANAGVTNIELIAENAALAGADGIYLVGVGVNKGASYNDKLMNEVTDAGKGASVYIPNEAEAWKIFGESGFENVMAIAGRNVQVQLTMPPGFEFVKFSGEEYSSDPDEVEPQHIAPNDAMVFHQQIRTCAPELIDDESEITVVATWEDPWTFEEKKVAQTWTFAELLGADQALLLKGAAVLAYADALLVYRDVNSATAKANAIEAALDAIALAQLALPADKDLAEIKLVLDTL